MLEAEYQELNKFTIEASTAIAQYHDKLEDNLLTDKDKQYLIEKILAKIDIVLALTMNIRHQLLMQITTAPATIKIQLNQALSELKTTMDTAKTLSFNYTAIYHGTRDRIKGTLE